MVKTKSLDVINDKSLPCSDMTGLECYGSCLKYGSSYEDLGSEATDGTEAPGSVVSCGAVFKKSTFLCPNADNDHSGERMKQKYKTVILSDAYCLMIKR